jgi:release factor glutamine methyltransferase
MKPNASQKQDLKTESLFKRVQTELQSHSESPYLDALVLLSHISGLSKSQVIANHDLRLDPDQKNLLRTALNKLVSGTPLPYVLGEWEFFKLKFSVSPDVLIPRPETEGLVELALEWLTSHPEQRQCLEIGTGSGCIAIVLTKHIPDLKITATDISSRALRIAQKNATAHHVNHRIELVENDLLNGIDQTVDLIVANLPYIPRAKLETLSVFGNEPTQALDGGEDGLRFIAEVLIQGNKLLNPDGAIFLELDEDCGAVALSLAKEVWPGSRLKLKQDLAGQDRYLCIYKNEQKN